VYTHCPIGQEYKIQYNKSKGHTITVCPLHRNYTKFKNLSGRVGIYGITWQAFTGNDTQHY